MQYDDYFDILMRFNIDEIRDAYLTSHMFENILLSRHFWSEYFKSYGLLLDVISPHTVKGWIDLFYHTAATYIIDHLANNDQIVSIKMKFTPYVLNIIKDHIDAIFYLNFYDYGEFDIQYIVGRQNDQFELGVLLMSKDHSPFNCWDITKEMAIQTIDMFLRYKIIKF